jgi:arylsulfatase A
MLSSTLGKYIMRKKLIIGLALLAAHFIQPQAMVCADGDPAPSTNSNKPNIILIIADDLGVGDVECYGGSSNLISTPNINRLASQGLLATDAHATASVCTPSRYSMLTGRYYHRYPYNWNGESLVEADRPTIASVLRQNGYATAYFGKVHTGWGDRSKERQHRQDIDWNKELPRGVLEMGFDTYFGIPFTHNEPPFVFVQDRQVVGLEANDPLLVIPKEVERGPWGWGLSKGAKAAHKARPVDEIDPIITDKAIAYIQAHQQQPFFMNLAFSAPHVPFVPSKAFKGHSKCGPYGDVVEQLDFCVGRVLETLDKLKLTNNTLVIFTSDNGAIFHDKEYATGHRSNLEWLGQKTDAWEGGVRVPLIVRWPGKVAQGKTLDPLISLIDIPQTVWAAAGITPPQAAGPDSLNQLPLLTGQTEVAIRSELYMIGITGQALRSGDWVYLPTQGSQGVTTNPAMTWAMQMAELGLTNSDYDEAGIIKADAPKAQLYNLRTDPRQSNNVIGQFPEMAKALAQRFAVVKKR